MHAQDETDAMDLKTTTRIRDIDILAEQYMVCVCEITPHIHICILAWQDTYCEPQR